MSKEALKILIFHIHLLQGSLEERGLIAWRKGLGMSKEAKDADKAKEARNLENASAYLQERAKRISEYVYTIPYADKLLKKFPKLRYLPFYPR